MWFCKYSTGCCYNYFSCLCSQEQFTFHFTVYPIHHLRASPQPARPQPIPLRKQGQDSVPVIIPVYFIMFFSAHSYKLPRSQTHEFSLICRFGVLCFPEATNKYVQQDRNWDRPL